MQEDRSGFLRDEMVDTQLIARGIRDPKVLKAFRKVPRHLCVPANIQDAAYDDCALPIGEGQTISQPYMVAIMTELLELTGKETILEIGAGSGYQAAILCELARKVISVERVKTLADRASNKLKELGYQNFEVVVGNGAKGYKKQAPYDRILVTAAADKIPQSLIDQLKEGGKLIIPVGNPYFQTLTIIEKIKGEIVTTESIGCVFVPLIDD
ncbi:MAG: protein-L-isoaspartate(D-aspartate) O-methyltransferase [Candidatus Margulisbacteria bacterium]|nr:protein-L-isoaspartate(D-aspartate) O-methyltransferase [Candidatus Margulisiibacteriota bacterium]MBU1022411.1 protein-L-isoaspartate(D-aspartate) O-methyltransferase [Candidatus Margulisiibacteriota bacterium]MBU1729037.1 protein-L-isoaspartate(D-aspartate) O-methyltransferase [Candidatus Margulisiibacteriota bacterium]MBU1954542.1 protein-L-isoaspartate(D-aspartate) O-methyltransferase [Candidatus Margulisiibacteriota bacterium]